ncbi:hypothetical protein DVH24_007982 [Malus domestica]|uniref:Uncharacterized protein n=1 Tax=Malus domestica TaxID=3750 RepID=A0A498JPG2_MALDO|nr:hypothetical protein DVH24_007982 [Malus domestica]
MNFRTIRIKGQYKVVPHDTQVIFTATTVFKKLSTVFPPIPRRRFFLLDFNILYPRFNIDDILTNVIGHITAVQQLEPKQINQIIVQKCDIHIENIKKDELSITLWKLSLPIIGVYKFKSQDLPWFSTCKVPANEAKILRTARRLTIDELAFLDPNLYKNLKTRLLVLQSSRIISTRFSHGDYIRKSIGTPNWHQTIRTQVLKKDVCLNGECGSAVRMPNSKTHFWKKHFGMDCKDLAMNQRLVDQQQLPNEFLRLIGQKKIFHLRFENRKNSFNSSDVLLYNVSDKTALEPITPQIYQEQP